MSVVVSLGSCCTTDKEMFIAVASWPFYLSRVFIPAPQKTSISIGLRLLEHFYRQNYYRVCASCSLVHNAFQLPQLPKQRALANPFSGSCFRRPLLLCVPI